MRLKYIARALVAGSMLLSLAAASFAQQVRGTVADSATSKPLDSSWVSLINGDEETVDRVLTDSSGRFVLSARVAGSHVVHVERLGYRAMRTGRLVLDSAAAMTLSLLLPPAAVELTPVTVTASPEAIAQYLARSGYLERKRTGQGVYLHGTALENRMKGAREFADVLRAIPGVSLIALGGDNAAVRLRGMESLQRPCRTPLVYLDGLIVAANDHGVSWAQLSRDLNTVVRLDHLLAIEVYRGPSELPAEYSGAESGCGVILIWTTHSAP